MSFHDPATNYAEALDNLTEENWHTERALVEAEVALLREIIYTVASVNDSADGAAGEAARVSPEAADIVRRIFAEH